MKRLLLVLLLLTCAVPAWAVTINVSSNAGLTSANSSADDDDVVVIAAGVYSVSIDPANSGSNGAVITYQGDPDDPSAVTVGGISIDKSYITVNSLSVSGSVDIGDIDALTGDNAILNRIWAGWATSKTLRLRADYTTIDSCKFIGLGKVDGTADGCGFCGEIYPYSRAFNSAIGLSFTDSEIDLTRSAGFDDQIHNMVFKFHKIVTMSGNTIKLRRTGSGGHGFLAEWYWCSDWTVSNNTWTLISDQTGGTGTDFSFAVRDSSTAWSITNNNFNVSGVNAAHFSFYHNGSVGVHDPLSITNNVFNFFDSGSVGAEDGVILFDEIAKDLTFTGNIVNVRGNKHAVYFESGVNGAEISHNTLATGAIQVMGIAGDSSGTNVIDHNIFYSRNASSPDGTGTDIYSSSYLVWLNQLWKDTSTDNLFFSSAGGAGSFAVNDKGTTRTFDAWGKKGLDGDPKFVNPGFSGFDGVLGTGSAAVGTGITDGYTGAIPSGGGPVCDRTVVSGAVLYVKPDGSGCECTQTTPCALSMANAIAGPGTEVILTSAQPYDEDIYPLNSGTDDSTRVTYMSADLDSAGWTQVRHIKLARAYVTVRGLTANGGAYFQHYADSTEDANGREVGAFRDSINDVSAKYLVFSGSERCVAYQDSISLGTNASTVMAAVRFMPSDTTANNATAGMAQSSDNKLVESYVSVDSLDAGEIGILVTNSLRDTLLQTVLTTTYASGADEETVGRKVVRSTDTNVTDSRVNAESYGEFGFGVLASALADTVVSATFLRDTVMANEETSMNGVTLSTVDVALAMSGKEGSKQNTWRSNYYKIAGRVRADVKLQRATIDSSVYISRYDLALVLAKGATGDIVYNTFLARGTVFRNLGIGLMEARLSHNIFMADSFFAFRAETDAFGVLTGDTTWTDAVVDIGGIQEVPMDFNLMYVRSSRDSSLQAIKYLTQSDPLTLRGHFLETRSNQLSKWGNPVFTDSLFPFASDVNWKGYDTSGKITPLACTWARDVVWAQGYAGAAVPNEPAGPDAISDLDAVVTTGDPATVTLVWTAVGDKNDAGCTPAFVEMAYVANTDTLGAPEIVLTSANFETYKTSVTKIVALGNGNTQQFQVPPEFFHNVHGGRNRYLIRVVDRFGNFGYATADVGYAP